MKNIFAGIISLCFSAAALAAPGDWKITKVIAKDNTVAGYVYHTSAVGTQAGRITEKAITGLRLVCSGKSASGVPVVAIFWNKMEGTSLQMVKVKTYETGRVSRKDIQWDQDGPLMMRSVSDSKELVNSFKTAAQIEFSWTSNDSVKRTTTFYMHNFNEHIAEFSTLCKTEL